MGEIRVHEFTTLDGVIDTPSWTFEFGFDPRMGEAIAGAMGGCQGILLGRTTYEMFAPAWSPRTAAEDPGAPFMNDTTKYVVSSTLRETSWRNSEVVGPYDAGRIQELKDAVHGGVYVSGSGTLVRALLADGLVDQLHLFVYPVVRGSGPRLFAGEAPPATWALSDCQRYDNGVVYLAYDRNRRSGS
ncbi:MAG TPA: dihydrofolate reductase family protein [Acidimicrobiales bacterium]|nr:dihydrofolate reductase family protein [Acidimicrobiales bacterium]